MRSCDIHSAMDRAHHLALNMWRSEETPEAINRLRIVMGLCRWLFNSLVHGLVFLSDNEDEGRRILQDGINIRASGEKLLQEGEKIMSVVSKYREGRKKQLNVAVLGFRKIQELRRNIESGEDKITKGKMLIHEGNTIILNGRKMLPRIPLTPRMINNIRRLYRVVQTKDSMDQINDGIKKLLLLDQRVTSPRDLKEIIDGSDSAAFDMGQARAEMVSAKLKETLGSFTSPMH